MTRANSPPPNGSYLEPRAEKAPERGGSLARSFEGQVGTASPGDAGPGYEAPSSALFPLPFFDAFAAGGAFASGARFASSASRFQAPLVRAVSANAESGGEI